MFRTIKHYSSCVSFENGSSPPKEVHIGTLENTRLLTFCLNLNLSWWKILLEREQKSYTISLRRCLVVSIQWMKHISSHFSQLLGLPWTGHLCLTLGGELGSSPYLGEVWAGSVPLEGALAPRSSTGDVHTGLLEANSKAYCRTSTKGNRLGPEP